MAIKLCDVQKERELSIREELEFYRTGINNYIQFFAGNSECSCYVCKYFGDEGNLCSLDPKCSLTDPDFVHEFCVSGIMNYFQEEQEMNQIGDESC